MTDDSNGNSPAVPDWLRDGQPRGMWQQGTDEHRVTITSAAGDLLFETVIPADQADQFEPPEDIQPIWRVADWSTVDDEPEVRKVITVFTIELGLDGTVLARPDFSARYDLLREANPSDMLTCCGRLLDELRADLTAEVIERRNDEALAAGLDREVHRGTRGVIDRRKR